MEKEKLVIKLRLEGNTYKQIQDQIGICKNTITGETIISIYPSLEHLKNIVNIYEYKRQSN